MNCQAFSDLSHLEKISFIGKLVHAVQSDNFAFVQAESIIEVAEISGLFKNVVINPQKQKPIKIGDKVFLPDGKIKTVEDISQCGSVLYFDNKEEEYIKNCEKVL